MRKFTPIHWNRNNHTIVTNYDWAIEHYLKGHNICIKVSRAADIVHIKRGLSAETQSSFILEAPDASLETIDIRPEWKGTDIVLILNRLGRFSNVFDKIGLIRDLRIRIIFCGNVAQNCTDCTILSSLGVHCGIQFDPEMDLPEEIQDLITYYFYGTRHHGEIEPFASMEHMYDEENYVSPWMAQMIDPKRFVYIDRDQRLSFRPLKEGEEGFDQGADKLPEISKHPAVTEASHEWQKLFIESDPCTFCPAFRVCLGFFSQQREKGRCREVMEDLLDGIEFSRKKNEDKSGENNRPEPEPQAEPRKEDCECQR